eukprot:GHVN01089662.1.p1 GENE.GHVN01089662.1~~GHVN01089662.1.p1  ORF type:complete len:654 (+),score=52.17 GHVN01089662.1:58-2019(+)
MMKVDGYNGMRSTDEPCADETLPRGVAMSLKLHAARSRPFMNRFLPSSMFVEYRDPIYDFLKPLRAQLYVRGPTKAESPRYTESGQEMDRKGAPIPELEWERDEADGKLRSVDLTEAYNCALEAIYGTCAAVANPSLARVLAIANQLGNCHLKLEVYHVVGSRAKSSVAEKLGSRLAKDGGCGVLTSPHISSFRERIQVNGQCIEEADVVILSHLIFAAAKHLGIQPTFGEMMTLMALLYFQQRGVQHAIFEIGVSGSLDPSHICKPSLVILTCIRSNELWSFASAIKHGVTLILGPKAADFEEVHLLAYEKNAEVVCVPSDSRADSFDEENQRIASYVLKKLNLLRIEQQSLPRRLPCRFQALSIEELQRTSRSIDKLLREAYIRDRKDRHDELLSVHQSGAKCEAEDEVCYLNDAEAPLVRRITCRACRNMRYDYCYALQRRGGFDNYVRAYRKASHEYYKRDMRLHNEFEKKRQEKIKLMDVKILNMGHMRFDDTGISHQAQPHDQLPENVLPNGAVDPTSPFPKKLHPHSNHVRCHSGGGGILSEVIEEKRTTEACLRAARLKVDRLHRHAIYPAPSGVILDIANDACSFERLCLEVVAGNKGKSLRICVCLPQDAQVAMVGRALAVLAPSLLEPPDFEAVTNHDILKV